MDLIEVENPKKDLDYISLLSMYLESYEVYPKEVALITDKDRSNPFF